MLFLLAPQQHRNGWQLQMEQPGESSQSACGWNAIAASFWAALRSGDFQGCFTHCEEFLLKYVNATHWVFLLSSSTQKSSFDEHVFSYSYFDARLTFCSPCFASLPTGGYNKTVWPQTKRNTSSFGKGVCGCCPLWTEYTVCFLKNYLAHAFPRQGWGMLSENFSIGDCMFLKFNAKPLLH